MKKGLIDLHTHTNYSDGELSPIKLCDFAKENGISVLSITDHNTIEGYKNLGDMQELGLKLIPGIEFDVAIDKGKLHILGYDIDINNQNLENVGKRAIKSNLERFKMILEVLKKDYAIVFDEEEVNRLYNSKFQVGKMDAAMLLLKHGYVYNLLRAFDVYINPILSDLRYDFKYPSYEEVINTIREAGGVASLAHPKSLQMNYVELDNFVKRLKSVGLGGIEVYHSSHLLQQMQVYRDIARKYNLYISGGSDFHGFLTKPDVSIGTGKDNLSLRNLSILKKLR